MTRMPFLFPRMNQMIIGCVLATFVFATFSMPAHVLGQGDVTAIDPTIIPGLDARYTRSMLIYGHSCVTPPNSGMVTMFC